MPEDREFQSLQLQLKVVTDRVRSVAHGLATGLYLCGRPGTSKTFTVRNTLELLGVPYIYHSGRLTAVGLFSLIEENPHRTIVLDDVTTVFRDPVAVELLLAALGNSGECRTVRYKTARVDKTVEFTGSIIAISNLSLETHDDHVLSALCDRINVIHYEPTDEQMISLMRHVASQGVEGVSPSQCRTVLNILLQECQDRNIRPSMRLFVDKAMKDFLLYARNQSQLDWRDLIVSSLQQQMIRPAHAINDPSRSDQIGLERRIVEDICMDYSSRDDRIRAWREQTGKSQAAFYRRLQDVKKLSKGFFIFP